MTHYYLGTFTDTEANPYYLTITHEDSQFHQDFLTFLNDTPFLIEWESGDGDTLYKPIKMSTATISILTDDTTDYKFGLYSDTAKHAKVILNDNNRNCVWAGYVTPSMYNIGYTKAREELQIDCIDGLSILKYFKYTPINGTSREIASFADIILHIARQTEVINHIYLADTIKFAEDDNDSWWIKCSIAEQNFFSEDEYDEEGNRIDDDDMSFLEVLEHICTYCGMTAILDGDRLIVMDYDGIVNYQRDYLHITVSDTPTYNTVQLKENYLSPTSDTVMESYNINGNNIHGNPYAESGQNLSLDRVYNKVVVKDSFYTFDTMIPSLLSDENITERYPTCNDPYNPTQYNMIKLTRGDNDRAFYSFHTNPNYKFHYFDENNNEIDFAQSLLTKPSGWTEDKAVLNEGVPMSVRGAYRGACVVKWHGWKSEEYPDGYDAATLARMPYFKPTNYLLLQHGNLTPYYGHPAVPLVEMTPTAAPKYIAGGAGLYLIISGTVTVFDLQNQFGYLENWSRREDWFRWYVPLTMKLSYAGQWWSGTQWQDTETTFFVRMIGENNDHWIGKELKIVNTVPWYQNINKEGWMIPLPTAQLTDDSPKLVIMSQNQPDTVGDRDYRIDQMWIKDFKVEFANYDPDNTIDNNDNSDTEYTNIIDTEHVEQLDDIEFKITTFDGKKTAYSIPCRHHTSTNTYTYIDGTWNKATQAVNEDGSLMRMEEHLIYRIVNQYTEPAKILEVTLNQRIKPYSRVTENNLQGVNFIIDTASWDLAHRKYEYKLIEKK